MGNVIGVCSWSLAPGSAAELARELRAVGLAAVQLGLDPLREGEWLLEETVGRLREAGVAIRSGMVRMRGEDYSTLASIRQTGGVRPDRYWPENLAAAEHCAALAGRLGIGLVTFHAGFLPAARGDPGRGVMVERLRAVIDRFAARGVKVGLESGQETAETLADVLEQLGRPEAGVNFDPANMILYGTGEPVSALRRLAPRVVQVHIKDALPAETPGTWGREVPVGSGAVNWPGLFAVVRERGLSCDLMIEREAEAAGRRADIRRARELAARFLGGVEGRGADG